MPLYLIYIIPISYLLALLVVFNRLSGDREIIALKAAGIGVLELTKPVLLYAFIPFALTLFLTSYAFPWGNSNFRDILYSLASHGGWSIQEKRFNDDFQGLVIYANSVSPNGRELNRVFISDERNTKEPSIITAQRGGIFVDKKDKRITLLLTDGRIYSKGVEDTIREVEFANYQVSLMPKGLTSETSHEKTNRELSITGLYNRIKAKELAGENPAPYIIDLHKRFVLPFSIMVFTLIGIPLGSHYRRGGSMRGFITGLIIVIVYYLVSTFMEFLGEGGSINPVLASWASNMLIGLLGLYLLYLSNYDSSSNLLMSIEEGIHRQVNVIKGIFTG